jgi:dihydroorotase
LERNDNGNSEMDILLKGGRLVDPASGRDETVDMRIRNGVIERMGRDLSPNSSIEAYDLRGKIVAPGFCDMHVHLREPGFEYKETIETGCASAAAGGFTAVCCMPNTNPPIDDAAIVRTIIEKGRTAHGGIVDVHPIAAVTRGREGKELAPMLELADAGAVGFSDDGAPIASSETMRRALEYARMKHRPIIQHAEDPQLSARGVMNEGSISTELGMPAIPPVAEEIMVQRDVCLVEYTGGQYHVAHSSTARTVDIIRDAKRRRLPVSCEVTPHHFTLTDEAVRSFDTNVKMNPPLRTRADVEAMLEGLRDGTIDVIATDHAPHSYDEKQVEFLFAPFGIVGLETAIGLAISELVDSKLLSVAQLIEKFSVNPRRILHLEPIAFQEGSRANLTILDPDVEWIVDTSLFRSKSKNSPFGGRRLKGRAFGIINNGQSTLPLS